MEEMDRVIAEILEETFSDQCQLVGPSLVEEVIASSTKGYGVEYAIPNKGDNISFLEIMSLLSAASTLIKFGLDLYDRISEASEEKMEKEIFQLIKEYPRFARVSKEDQIKIIKAIQKYKNSKTRLYDQGT